MPAATARGNERIAREMYDAFNRGDIETVTASMHDDIEWIEPEGAIDGGTYHGVQAVVDEVFGPVDESFETMEVTIDRTMDCGTDTVVLGRFVGTTRTGHEMDIPYAHVLRFEDGKLSRFQNYTDTAAWNDALGDAE